MTRRTFSGAVFAGLGVPRPAKPKSGAVPTRVFGKTGVKLSVIGQGGARMALLRTKEAARTHLRRVFDTGINYFDCAASYWEGRSEEVYGEALHDLRKEIFLTTKCGRRTAKEAAAELDQSLKRLRTDHIDLWQMHGVGKMEEVDRIFAPGGAIEAFEAAKKAGKVRFFGFTGHEDPHVHVAMLKRYGKWDSILMPLHAADPAYLSFEKIALPLAVERGIGIQGMKNFGNSFLLRALSAQECLSYVLSLPIHCTAVGMSTAGQIADDVNTAEAFRPLPAAEMDRLRAEAKNARGAVTGPAMEYWKKNVG